MDLAGMSIASPWLVMMMRTVIGIGRSCDSASRSHDTKASVVQDPKVSGHYFIFQHRAGRNVDSVSMVGYDDDRSLPKQRNNQTVQHPAKTSVCGIIFFICFLLLPLQRRTFRRSRHQTPSSDPALACLECSRIVWDIPEPEGQKETGSRLHKY